MKYEYESRITHKNTDLGTVQGKVNELKTIYMCYYFFRFYYIGNPIDIISQIKYY